jgi:hypothetical protein
LTIGRPRHSTVAAYLALFVALGGTGYAAVQLEKNSVGAKQIKKNAVRSAEVKNRSLLKKDFKAGQLPRGPQGIPGPTGERGLAGEPATRLWIAVSATGTVAQRSSSTISITAVDTVNGDYTIDFGRDVSACAATATLASLDATPPASGEILLFRESARTVFADVRTSEGADTGSGGRPFAVTVFC